MNINKIINFFLPGNCVLCNSALANNERSICNVCANNLIPKENLCELCADELQDYSSKICGKCMSNPPKWQQAIIPFSYKGTVGFLLKELKFRHHLGVIEQLANKFADTLTKLEPKMPDMIIPVPLHRSRLAKRGFNQSFEIAKNIAAYIQVPIANNVCYRSKNTMAQTGLNSKVRQENLKHAFNLAQPEMIKNKHIVLFDDVFTTGATLNSIARTCRPAKRIDIWCIAKTV